MDSRRTEPDSVLFDSLELGRRPIHGMHPTLIPHERREMGALSSRRGACIEHLLPGTRSKKVGDELTGFILHGDSSLPEAGHKRHRPSRGELERRRSVRSLLSVERPEFVQDFLEIRAQGIDPHGQVRLSLVGLEEILDGFSGDSLQSPHHPRWMGVAKSKVVVRRLGQRRFQGVSRSEEGPEEAIGQPGRPRPSSMSRFFDTFTHDLGRGDPPFGTKLVESDAQELHETRGQPAARSLEQPIQIPIQLGSPTNDAINQLTSLSPHVGITRSRAIGEEGLQFLVTAGFPLDQDGEGDGPRGGRRIFLHAARSDV